MSGGALDMAWRLVAVVFFVVAWARACRAHRRGDTEDARWHLANTWLWLALIGLVALTNAMGVSVHNHFPTP